MVTGALIYRMVYIIIITSTSDLRPSTAITNQLPDQSVSTQNRTIEVKPFKIHHFIDSAQHRDCSYS